jgi:hypothetical protein
MQALQEHHHHAFCERSMFMMSPGASFFGVIKMGSTPPYMEQNLIREINTSSKDILVKILHSVIHNESCISTIIVKIKQSNGNLTIVPENFQKNLKYFTNFCEPYYVMISDAHVDNGRRFEQVAVGDTGKVTVKLGLTVLIMLFQEPICLNLLTPSLSRLRPGSPRNSLAWLTQLWMGAALPPQSWVLGVWYGNRSRIIP